MKPEIMWSDCPVCDVKRPFMVEYEGYKDSSNNPVAYFTCLGCGEFFDNEGTQAIQVELSDFWRRTRISGRYEWYREEHDQFRRYSQTAGQASLVRLFLLRAVRSDNRAGPLRPISLRSILFGDGGDEAVDGEID